MNIEFIGFTILTAGELLVGFTAVMVHRRFWKEHKVDETLFKEMKKEQIIGIVGLVLIGMGYLLQVIGRFS